MNYEELIDQLMHTYSSATYRQEIDLARREFSERVGILDDDAAYAEQKMRQFIDWYVLSRKLVATNKTPAEEHVETLPQAAGEDRLKYQNLALSRHSLFEFIRQQGQVMWVRDIFSTYKFEVVESPVTIGIEKNDIFEAHLIPHREQFSFGQGFCLHPQAANRFIHREVKLWQKSSEAEREPARQKLMLRLQRMFYKHLQYQHVDVTNIYSNESKLNL